jgi:hypothetical protein
VGFCCAEVHDEAADDDLAPELDAELAAPNRAPENLFGGRRRSARAARMLLKKRELMSVARCRAVSIRAPHYPRPLTLGLSSARRVTSKRRWVTSLRRPTVRPPAAGREGVRFNGRFSSKTI